MTVPASVERNDYTGNGSVSVYAYGYRITSDTHLLVTVATPAGVETTLAKGTDYTVSGVGVSTGGNVTLASSGQAWLTAGKLTTGWLLTVRHVVPLSQSTDIRNQGVFYPETHEDAFDYLMWSIKQQQDELNRCLKSGETDLNPPSLDDIDTAVAAAQAAQAAAETAETNAETAEVNAETAETNAEAAQAAAEAAAASVTLPIITGNSLKYLRANVGETALEYADGGGVAGDGTVGLVNLIQNGDFENWSAGASVAPDYWGEVAETTVGLTIAREGTIKESGSYSLKISHSTAGSIGALNLINPRGVAYWRGKTVTIRARVYGTAGDGRIYMQDGVLSGTDVLTQTNTWQTLTITHTFSNSATGFIVSLYTTTGAAVYCDNISVVEGASQFAFTPHPNDLHKSKTLVFTRDISAVDGDVPYIGFGFTPKQIIITAAVNATAMASWGQGDLDKDSSIVGYGTTYGTANNYVVYMANSTGTVQDIATIKSFDSDGFTLTWAKTGSPTGSAQLNVTAFG